MGDVSRESGWHLKKEIQVTHLISTGLIAASAIVYVGDIKRDVEVLKAKVQAQDERTVDTVNQLREQLKSMDQKLDRLIENRK